MEQSASQPGGTKTDRIRSDGRNRQSDGRTPAISIPVPDKNNSVSFNVAASASPIATKMQHKRQSSGGSLKNPGFHIAMPTSRKSPAATNPEAFEFKGHVVSTRCIVRVDGKEYEASKSKFQFLEKAGRGIHGTVHKVRHLETGTIMALKEIELGRVTDASSQRIVRELDVLKSSNCPNIVDYHGAFYKHGSIHILMHYMNVGSLDKILQMESVDKFPEGIVRKVALCTLKGLRYLQKHLRIIHRDVKPSNILVNTAGEVKVCDFSVSGELVRSCVNTYVGTMYYMAPERICPQGQKNYSVRADVWSLGVTLVELATGQYPYPREQSVFNMLHHIVDGPTPVDKLCDVGEVSQEFHDLIKSCLDKNPENRPSYKELLVHPFIIREDGDKSSDIAAWLNDIGAHELVSEQ